MRVYDACFKAIKLNGIIDADKTGWFPVTRIKGKKHILVAQHHGSNIAHSESIKK